MDFTTHKGPTRTDVMLRGHLSFADHDAFLGVLAVVEEVPGHRVVLDLSRLESMDSSGLGMLIIARDVASQSDVTLVLRAPRDAVRRVIQRVGAARKSLVLEG
jgi:anti-anti-sigma factor